MKRGGWDSYRCHITDQVEDALLERSTDVIVVPGGCTKVLKPADVSWNAPFKGSIGSTMTIRQLKKTDQ